MLKALNFFCYHSVLTRHAYQPTYINVRFKAQTYTDRGPTTKFKNIYNVRVIRVKDGYSFLYFGSYANIYQNINYKYLKILLNN